jgi:hypothetical protein
MLVLLGWMEYLDVCASSRIFFLRLSFEPKVPLCILIEASDLRVTFLHSSVDMTQTYVIFLSNYDFIPQGR